MNNIKSAIDNLSEKTRRLNIALYYTREDIGSAKKMVSGVYKDLYVIKATFTSASLYGAFIVFFNNKFISMTDSFYLISPDYSIINMNPQEDWKVFDSEIESARQKITNQRTLKDFKDKLDMHFTADFAKDLNRFFGSDDITLLTHLFEKFLQDSINVSRVDLNIEYQNISSLDMELHSNLNNKLSQKIIDKKRELEQEELGDAPLNDAPVEPEAGKNGIKLLVKSSLILSPIKGKHISQLEVGDRIRLTMIESSRQVIQIAEAFKAYDKENDVVKPIPGRVTFVEYVDGVGYKVYAMIAKGIAAQIIEEETNIKVELDPAYLLAQKNYVEPKSKSMGMPAIVALVAAILGLVAVVVLMLLK